MNKLFLCCLLILLLLLSCAQAEDTTLYVFGSSGAGEFDNETLKKTNPDIHWTGVEVQGNNNAKDMALQMQTNNRCFDLYSIGYAYCGFVTLRDRGFCLDLSSYPEITELVGQVSNAVGDISKAIEQVATGSERIVRSVETIDELSEKAAGEAQTVSAATEEQSASMEEIASSSQELAKLAMELREAVGKFQV